MVASSLKAEILSARFSNDILARLRRDGIDRRVINQPDLNRQEENHYRIRLLGDFRGYKQHRDIFEAFPDDISWHRIAVSKEELTKVQYIDYSYWVVLSNGSRSPIDAAKNIRAGIEVFGQSTQGFLKIAQALKNGGPRLNSFW